MQRDGARGGTARGGSPLAQWLLPLDVFFSILAAGLLGASFGLLLDWLELR